MSGLVSAAFLGLVIGVERFLDAVLVDGIASYASTPLAVGGLCGATGMVLLAISAIAARRPRRPPPARRPRRYGGPR